MSNPRPCVCGHPESEHSCHTCWPCRDAEVVRLRQGLPTTVAWFHRYRGVPRKEPLRAPHRAKTLATDLTRAFNPGGIVLPLGNERAIRRAVEAEELLAQVDRLAEARQERHERWKRWTPSGGHDERRWWWRRWSS